MPGRNSQNPIKTEKGFGQGGTAPGDSPALKVKSTGGGGRCPACDAEVPPKPGFRFSALKCPKCGASMGKK